MCIFISCHKSNQNNTTQKHPGFQDCYDSDDDCLSTTYSAAFVAEDWIKSLPCGKGADCLPEELSHPGTMKDSVRHKQHGLCLL